MRIIILQQLQNKIPKMLVLLYQHLRNIFKYLTTREFGIQNLVSRGLNN